MASEQRPEPAGFGDCPDCAYAATGSAAFCFDCASETMETLAADRCEYCELELKDDGKCGNPICNWSDADRYFDYVWAISMRSGALLRAIDRYKVDGVEGWSWIFGRVLVGYLNRDYEVFQRFDLMIPSPTFVGEGGRAFDHTAAVIERAQIEDAGDDPEWPFAPDVLVKTAATPRLRGLSWKQRKTVAETQLRAALNVADGSRVVGKNVLVYDDVFTEGFTIREVARALKNAGANEVSQVVLARQPWG